MTATIRNHLLGTEATFRMAMRVVVKPPDERQQAMEKIVRQFIESWREAYPDDWLRAAICVDMFIEALGDAVLRILREQQRQQHLQAVRQGCEERGVLQQWAMPPGTLAN